MGKREMAAWTVVLLAVAVWSGCGDAPTVPQTASLIPAPMMSKDKVKASKGQFARVKSDGTLVDGTAASSARFGDGTYYIEFDEPISECAAAANSAAFQGFDQSVFRVAAQISIGTEPGGGFNERSVGVSTFDTLDGSRTDTSFSLILMCP